MNKIAVELRGDSTLIVNAHSLDADSLRSVPGARYQRSADEWVMPATRTQIAMLSALFAARLEPSSKVRALAHSLFQEPEPETVSADLRLMPFQLSGVQFLVSAGSALLGDDMGLGKTVQAIMWMANMDPKGYHLVVCPNTLKYNWAEELERWWPEVPVVVVDGTASQRRKQLASYEGGVLVINYESLRTHTRLAPWGGKKLTEAQKAPKELQDFAWSTVVVDEAHKIKDPGSLQTLAVKQMGAQAKHRLAMTGTPQADSPDDLWSIMSFVEPNEYGSRNQFRRAFCIMQPGHGTSWVNEGLRPDREGAFRSVFDRRFLRRTKAGVLPQLPEKYPTRYHRVPLTSAQEKAYKALKKDKLAVVDGNLVVATNPLELVTRLLQIASAVPSVDDAGNVVSMETPSNKLDAIKDILEAGGRDEQFVVFARSRLLIDMLERELSGSYLIGRITGSESAQERQEVIERFQDHRLDLVLGTLGAGAEGVTLTAASTVIIAEQSWSHIQNSQAIDRVYRIGQTKAVQPIVLVSAGTLDEEVMKADQRKKTSFQELVKDPVIVKKMLLGEPYE